MASTRRRSERVVLLGDLDRFDAGRALFPRSRTATALDAAVRAAVAGALTPRQRAIVEACFFEGLSQGAVARRLGVAQQVVQKALFGDVRRGRRVGGALARLRAALLPVIGSYIGQYTSGLSTAGLPSSTLPTTTPCRAPGPVSRHGH